MEAVVGQENGMVDDVVVVGPYLRRRMARDSSGRRHALATLPRAVRRAAVATLIDHFNPENGLATGG